MNKKKLRMLIDILMIVFSIILMGGTLLFENEKIHQHLGMLMFVFWICHAILNRKWFSSIFRPNYFPYRIMQLVVNLGIFISAVFLMLSGIMLASFLPINFGLGFARTSHLLSSHWYYFFMSLHLGFHIQMIFNSIQTSKNKKSLTMQTTKNAPSKAKSAIRYTVLFLVCAYGAYSFYNLGIAKYMFYVQQFFFLDIERGYFFFFADYISMLVLIATLSHFLGKFLLKMQNKKSKKIRKKDNLDS
ncbi:DUF4405 domain-containing protein [Treponema pectinovorum]|uniref:DUF4405 domain-containing protein n=1 Tax=Treponema pectinovorum TaxID=164 RepID=UPI003D89C337